MDKRDSDLINRSTELTWQEFFIKGCENIPNDLKTFGSNDFET